MKMMNINRAYFRPILHATLTPFVLRNYWKTSIFVHFWSKFSPFPNFCSVRIMSQSRMLCPEYPLAVKCFPVLGKIIFIVCGKIIKVECNYNTSLGSACLQKYHQSFKCFILFLGCYRHSFTTSLWRNITLWKLVPVEIKFCDIWSFSQKPVPVKAIGKLSIGKI